MYSLFRTKAFLTYWLNAVDEHSLHSPFFYDLHQSVIKPPATPMPVAEEIRRTLLNDRSDIEVHDLGRGSVAIKGNQRTVSNIARTSLAPPRFCSLYLKLAQHMGATSIIELGTSLGITALYLAQAPGSVITTFEGAPSIAALARRTFELGGAKNIDLIPGNIDHTLASHLQPLNHFDFALIDANHQHDATVKYFDLLARKTHDRSVVIVDDIYLTPDMKRAWEYIRKHRLVYGSIDIYKCGILFFNPSLNKQHAVLQH
ncbi:MAG: SAM-dependent methyltransferase [Bacteroidia bacterium]|nr:SAM-dependent methyltransferase [Bacteroidia bacterium]